MKRSNRYEAAFEAYLQAHRIAYIGVDETRRSFLGEGLVKNLDFIVLGEKGARLLIDVKGRRFPGGSKSKPRSTWECWSTSDDVAGLQRWVEVFGEGYRGLLVFMYRLMPSVELAEDAPDQFVFRDERYLLRAVAVDEYAQHLKVRSRKWGTVDLPRAIFRRLVQPFQDFCTASPAWAEVGS